MIGTLRISIRKIYSICTKGQTNQNKYFYGYPVIKDIHFAIDLYFLSKSSKFIKVKCNTLDESFFWIIFRMASNGLSSKIFSAINK